MRGKITKRSVDALKAAADGAETVLWDSELKGFGVRVQRGGAKSYVLHYRVGTGRGAPLRKLTIGRHGSPWTPETARKEAKTLLGMIEDGADPAADKMARREAPTIAELAERFLAEHADAKRKGSTAAEYRRLLDKIILPALGKRKAADVTARGRSEVNMEIPDLRGMVGAVEGGMGRWCSSEPAFQPGRDRSHHNDGRPTSVSARRFRRRARAPRQDLRVLA